MIKKVINRKKIPKNENPNKIVNIAEEILNFNKQQKDKGFPLDLVRIARVGKASDHSNLKILTPKQILQRLPIALGISKLEVVLFFSKLSTNFGILHKPKDLPGLWKNLSSSFINGHKLNIDRIYFQ